MTVATLSENVRQGWARVPRAPAWLREALSWAGLALLGLTVAALVFVALAPRLLGWQFVVVRGGSMEPTIHFGSVAVMTRPDRAHLAVGDVVMYHDPRSGHVVTHRIAAISSDGRAITTRGDANNTPDEGSISPANVTGSYLFSVPEAGNFVTWMGTRDGFLAIILLPGLLIIALELASIGRSLRPSSAPPSN
jgi:signal peptidase I